MRSNVLCCFCLERLVKALKESLHVCTTNEEEKTLTSWLVLLTWIYWCILRRPAREYFLLQPFILQTKGLTPVWITSWACMCLLVMKRKLHSGHLKGLSPVWLLICVFRLPVSLNYFRQWKNGQIRNFDSVFGRLTRLISSQFRTAYRQNKMLVQGKEIQRGTRLTGCHLSMTK